MRRKRQVCTIAQYVFSAVMPIALLTDSSCVNVTITPTGNGTLVETSTEVSKTKSMAASEAVQRPYFEDAVSRNVSAVIGGPAILNCRVKYPGDRTVSWIRKQDLHILTSNAHTYTGDGRFSVMHRPRSGDWRLRIDDVQPADAGVYECQINTEPKINMAVTLHVQDVFLFSTTTNSELVSAVVNVARATIWGSQDVYVKKGSTIALTCSVKKHSIPPVSILWLHDASIVDLNSMRGGISLETEKTETRTTSKLQIKKAALTDTGNYTCMPTYGSPDTVAVHVLNGEEPAAMQTSFAIYEQRILTTLVFLLPIISVFGIR